MTDIPRLFDTGLLMQRRVRAFRKYGSDADFLLAETTTDMLDRLAVVLRQFPVCVELGGHTGILAQALVTRPGTEQVIRVEQSPALLTPGVDGQIMHEEQLSLDPQSINLLVSPLFLHWINDLPGLLIQIRQCLAPDGLFLATLLGRDSLKELRAAFLQADSETSGGASPRVAPLPDLRDMGSLLQRAGFALPVADQDTVTVRYNTMFDLMQDLRKMGATNILHERSRKPLRRKTLLRAAEIYQDKFADPGGRIRASFQILSLSGWSPHDSQQQPLKPGSAQRSLADALGDKSENGKK